MAEILELDLSETVNYIYVDMKSKELVLDLYPDVDDSNFGESQARYFFSSEEDGTFEKLGDEWKVSSENMYPTLLLNTVNEEVYRADGIIWDFSDEAKDKLKQEILELAE